MSNPVEIRYDGQRVEVPHGERKMSEVPVSSVLYLRLVGENHNTLCRRDILD